MRRVYSAPSLVARPRTEPAHAEHADQNDGQQRDKPLLRAEVVDVRQRCFPDLPHGRFPSIGFCRSLIAEFYGKRSSGSGRAAVPPTQRRHSAGNEDFDWAAYSGRPARAALEHACRAGCDRTLGCSAVFPIPPSRTRGLRPRGPCQGAVDKYNRLFAALGDVAQLVRVPDCRSGGCGFESRRPRSRKVAAGQ